MTARPPLTAADLALARSFAGPHAFDLIDQALDVAGDPNGRIEVLPTAEEIHERVKATMEAMPGPGPTPRHYRDTTEAERMEAAWQREFDHYRGPKP